MAYLVIVVNVPGDNIASLNDQTQFPTKVDESIQGAINALQAIGGGHKPASVQITTRSTDPSVSTAGSGSQQNTYSHL